VPGNNDVNTVSERFAIQSAVYGESDWNVVNSAVRDELIPEKHGFLGEREGKHMRRR
jgi:hypothetical protein